MEMVCKTCFGVLYRLDKHDHSQHSQSIYWYFERGLEIESPSSVSGQGFHEEITPGIFSKTTLFLGCVTCKQAYKWIRSH